MIKLVLLWRNRRAISILATQNGITQKEIADKLDLDTSSLIPLLDRLESKELVNRKPDNTDRRINRLYITKKTESLLGQMQLCAKLFKRSLIRRNSSRFNWKSRDWFWTE